MITRQPLAISLSPVLLPVAKVALLLGVVLCLAQPAWADLTDYAIFGNSWVTYNEGSVNGDGSQPVYVGGSVGSNGPITFWRSAVVTRNVDAVGNVTFGPYGHVDGVVTTPLFNASFFTGSVSHSPLFEGIAYDTWPPEFGKSGFEAGDLEVEDSADLTPGTYGDLVLENNKALTLTSGDYYFSNFIVGNNLELNLDLADGPIGIYVVNVVALANRPVMTLLNVPAETLNPADLVFCETLGSWSMGNDAVWSGTVYAPYGSIAITSNLMLEGALYGESVTVGIIPAPGAIVLGAIGLGLVGYLKRRF